MNALAQSAIHADEFAALCIDISEGTLQLWEAKILSWERDRDQPNPYFNPASGRFNGPCIEVTSFSRYPPGPSESEIRKRLALEEEKEEVASAAPNPGDDFTETKYLIYGLDLEERQLVILGGVHAHRTDRSTGINCRLRSSPPPRNSFPFRSWNYDLPSVVV